MKATLPLILLMTPMLIAGTAPASPPATELPLATVNDEPVHAEDLARHLGRIHQSANQIDRAGFDTERLMFKLVNDVLLGQEARAAGLNEDPGIVAQLTEYREELVYKYLEKIEIDDQVEPTTEAARQLFQEQYEEMQLRIITAQDETSAAAILEELEGGADMETLASERSIDHVRARGGLMRPARRNKLPRVVADAAAGLETGALGGPVQTDLGWTVFRIESRTEANPEDFAMLEDRLKAILRADKARALRAALARTAREHHQVVLNQPLIDALKPKRETDGRLVAEAPDPDAVVARIGDHRKVLAGDYAHKLGKRWRGVRSEEAAVAAAPIILTTLIERELLVAEGERRGYGELPRVQALLRARETQLLIPRYLDEIVASGIEVSGEEMAAYYEDHVNEFLRPPRVRMGQVTVATLEKAEQVAAMLRGGADLAWVAQQHSIDNFKEQGGLRDWMVPTPELDAFQDLLLATEAGGVLDPFGPEGNVIVIKVVAREEQGPFEFDEVSGNVREALIVEKSRAAIDRTIKTLRARSEIVLYDDRIRALNLSGTFEEETEGGNAPGGHGH